PGLKSAHLGPLRPSHALRLPSQPERANFRPERKDFRPERADSRPERALGRQKDERKSPCVLQDIVPFGAAALLPFTPIHNQAKQGNGYR
ncbi:MAG: hypothetical protein VX367_11410, partial [SAR324 cluster bacterium]|nr:hypothetical protein [SAR324 cluster bacterium]